MAKVFFSCDHPEISPWWVCLEHCDEFNLIARFNSEKEANLFALWYNG